jgi:hypothetical protein
MAVETFVQPPLTGDGTSSNRKWAPSWEDVEELLGRLAEPDATFSTTLTSDNRISSYERGRRLMIQSDIGTQWVAVESIRECWDTFERLGRIRRQDVLEPGRCSAFMMALFLQVPGVVEQVEGDVYLVLTKVSATD